MSSFSHNPSIAATRSAVSRFTGLGKQLGEKRVAHIARQKSNGQMIFSDQPILSPNHDRVNIRFNRHEGSGDAGVSQIVRNEDGRIIEYRSISQDGQTGDIQDCKSKLVETWGGWGPDEVKSACITHRNAADQLSVDSYLPRDYGKH